MRTIVSISLEPNLVKMAKDNKICISHAARLGIEIELADRGLMDPPRFSTYDKMRHFQTKLSELSAENKQLRAKMDKIIISKQ